MDLNQINASGFVNEDEKLKTLLDQINTYLLALDKKEIPENIVHTINNDIQLLNTSTLKNKDLKILFKQKQTDIIKLVEKELKIVPKNYYRNLWMPIAMAGIGLPIGSMIGLLSKNMGLLAIGLPIGLGIGAIVGGNLDKKAFNENRQLDMEIKY